MARRKSNRVARSGDMNMALGHLLRKNATMKGKRPAGSTHHVSLTHSPHHVDHGYLKAKRANGGRIPSNSTDLLKMASHHGKTAKTHHGPGGMKPHKMRIPK